METLVYTAMYDDRASRIAYTLGKRMSALKFYAVANAVYCDCEIEGDALNNVTLASMWIEWTLSDYNL